jgi:hypothetical protein
MQCRCFNVIRAVNVAQILYRAGIRGTPAGQMPVKPNYKGNWDITGIVGDRC